MPVKLRIPREANAGPPVRGKGVAQRDGSKGSAGGIAGCTEARNDQATRRGATTRCGRAGANQRAKLVATLRGTGGELRAASPRCAARDLGRPPTGPGSYADAANLRRWARCPRGVRPSAGRRTARTSQDGLCSGEAGRGDQPRRNPRICDAEEIRDGTLHEGGQLPRRTRARPGPGSSPPTGRRVHLGGAGIRGCAGDNQQVTPHP